MQIRHEPTESSPFRDIGGEQGVKNMVERFYDLMDSRSEFKHLRELHGLSLDQARQRTFWFLCGWLGGPQHYTDRFGHPRLRARHLHVPIGIQERDEWLACMTQAMQDTGVNESLQKRLQASFFQTADWMRNQSVAM